MKKGEAKVQTVLRLAPSMREWLLGKADSNGRTINGEVIYRLKKMMEEETQGEQKQRA
ncbi:Arc family DNA-binding protein [Pseudomonas sp. GTC 16482]|uniref:Arc family DNA-binding protein n=1 Tax=Pseudomonas sp. GTC 16482 TaxID=1661693 RepID=UPI0009E69CC6|nr:Arc family DNA-binding protein [Pseudomonas sp. GTC 16482]